MAISPFSSLCRSRSRTTASRTCGVSFGFTSKDSRSTTAFEPSAGRIHEATESGITTEYSTFCCTVASIVAPMPGTSKRAGLTASTPCLTWVTVTLPLAVPAVTTISAVRSPSVSLVRSDRTVSFSSDPALPRVGVTAHHSAAFGSVSAAVQSTVAPKETFCSLPVAPASVTVVVFNSTAGSVPAEFLSLHPDKMRTHAGNNIPAVVRLIALIGISFRLVGFREHDSDRIERRFEACLGTSRAGSALAIPRPAPRRTCGCRCRPRVFRSEEAAS